jgi:hypothetical protein
MYDESNPKDRSRKCTASAKGPEGSAAPNAGTPMWLGRAEDAGQQCKIVGINQSYMANRLIRHTKRKVTISKPQHALCITS